MFHFSQATPSIRFLCRPEDHGVIAPPVPAKTALPDWFRKLPAVDPHQVSATNNGLTVKRCMPFLDAMTSGWILPLAATVRRGVQVTNMSLSGPANALLEQLVRRLAERGMVIVAAAGNEGPKAGPAYPAAYADVIAVTAVDRMKRPYRRAGRGEHIDLSAPGVDIWTAASVSGARPKTGTSFAAPFVTAAAALMKSANDGTTAAEIHDALGKSAEDLGAPGKDVVFGWGLLNTRAACATTDNKTDVKLQ